MAMSNPVLEAARRYRAKNWLIMPLNGKKPVIQGWSEDGNLAPEISLGHENTLHRWFGNGANVAVCTGLDSGLFVLDIDGGEGERWLSEKGFVIPEGPQVLTARGKHCYFKYPEGMTIRNSVKIAPDIDIRGQGGCVAAPPSVHPSGHIYAWARGTEDLPLPPCPQWLLDLIATRGEQATQTAPQPRADLPILCEGRRNDGMYSLACSLRAKGLTEGAILAALSEENRLRCDPPLPEKEIDVIARQAGKKQPGTTAQKTSPPPVTADELLPLLQTFNQDQGEKPDLIGGLFRRGYVSLIVGEPGLGKSLLVQRLVCDLSRGGALLDGYSTSEPMSTLIFTGEAGLGLLNHRLRLTGWRYDPSRIAVCDGRKMWSHGVNLTLSSDAGRDVFSELITAQGADLVIIDSLGSFVNDESDRSAMGDSLEFLMRVANKTRCALALIHHLRKRRNNERSLPLDASDVLGSSLLIRHAALVLGLEKRAIAGDDESGQHEVFVHSLKSWDRPIAPFCFRLIAEEGGDGEKLTMSFNLAPSSGDGKQAVVWAAITKCFGDGAEFTRNDLVRLCDGVSPVHIKKLLARWTEMGRLCREGTNRQTTYRIHVPPQGGKEYPVEAQHVGITGITTGYSPDTLKNGVSSEGGNVGISESKPDTHKISGYAPNTGEDPQLDTLPVSGCESVIPSLYAQLDTPDTLPVSGLNPAMSMVQTLPDTKSPSLLDMLGEDFPDGGSEPE
jgi:archaellum biogenesis ATPase FlaH